MPKNTKKQKAKKKVQQQNRSNNCGEGRSKNTQKISKIDKHKDLKETSKLSLK